MGWRELSLKAVTFKGLQTWGVVHVPQVYVPPQPFDTVPQFLPEHAFAIVNGVQEQTWVEPQTWPAAQVPQPTVRVVPQLSLPVTAPQFLPRRAQKEALDSRAHSAR